jgi:hypothetical protein
MDDLKENCAESFGINNGNPLSCYEGYTRCGDPMTIVFTAGAVDDYVKFEYSGPVISSVGNVWTVLPGGTAQVIYGNTYTLCGSLESATISSSKGHYSQLATPYRCGKSELCGFGAATDNCPDAPYEMALVILEIPNE